MSHDAATGQPLLGPSDSVALAGAEPLTEPDDDDDGRPLSVEALDELFGYKRGAAGAGSGFTAGCAKGMTKDWLSDV